MPRNFASCAKTSYYKIS